eukprot:jgi/Tetstr1/428632/TSEL_018621.t1
MARTYQKILAVAVLLAAAALPSSLARNSALSKFGTLSATRCPSDCNPEWLGDGLCDSACNVEACNFDGGDCEKCAPGCFLPLIGDGHCQRECFNSQCNFDAGDCDGQCAPGCEPSFLGDNVCDSVCDNEACNRDEGDCATCDPEGLCFTASMVGDGYCHVECNNEACQMDSGDCEGMCAPGCEASMLGDGFCYDPCNNEACSADGGDCLPLADGSMPHIFYEDGRDYITDYEQDSWEAECAPGCEVNMLGDGHCIDVCNNAACKYDAGDCVPGEDGVIPHVYYADGRDYIVDYEHDEPEDEQCAPGCEREMLADGYCIDVCNNTACHMDGGDCLQRPDGTMPLVYYADGRDYIVDYEEDGN